MCKVVTSVKARSTLAANFFFSSSQCIMRACLPMCPTAAALDPEDCSNTQKRANRSLICKVNCESLTTYKLGDFPCNIVETKPWMLEKMVCMLEPQNCSNLEPAKCLSLASHCSNDHLSAGPGKHSKMSAFMRSVPGAPMEPIQNDCSILNQRSQVIRNENFWANVSLMLSAVASEWSKLSAKDFLASTQFFKIGASIVVAVFGRCPIKSFSLHKASTRQLSTATVRSKASRRQLYSSKTLVSHSART